MTPEMATVILYSKGVEHKAFVPAELRTLCDDGTWWSAVKCSEVFKAIRQISGIEDDFEEEPEGYLAVRNGHLFPEVFQAADLALSWAAIAVETSPKEKP